MLRVQLKPQIGIENTPLGPVEVEFDQWEIYASYDGSEPRVRVGYLGKHANAHIQPIADLPDAVWDEIKRLCEEQKKGEVSGVVDFSPIRDVLTKLAEENGENSGRLTESD